MQDRVAGTQWLSSREVPYDLHQQPLVSVTIAALVGILAERITELGLVGLFTIVSLVLFLTLQFRGSRRAPGPWTVLLVGMATACGLHARNTQLAYHHASLLNALTPDPQPCVMRVRVRSDLQLTETIAPDFERRRTDADSIQLVPQWQTVFTADVLELRYAGQWRANQWREDQWLPIDGGVRVILEASCEQLAPGDVVELSGDLSSLKPPTNPGEADYRLQARYRNFHAKLIVPSAANHKLIQAGSWSLARFSYRMAQSAERLLRAELSPQTASLAIALVLGRRTSLDPQLKEQLLETGTIHLLSVSGLHLGVVAVAMVWSTTILGFGRWSQAVLVGAACLLFAAVTGANPPVMRAALLVTTVLISQWVLRRHLFINSLACAGLILLLHNPENATQVGVQLSFLSVATLSLVTRAAANDEVQQTLHEESTVQKIEALVAQTRPRWQRTLTRWATSCKRCLWYSLCVTLVTTPLTWLHFNVISVISVIANLLLTIPASIALIMGLIAAVVGPLWQPLSWLPARGCEWSLQLVMTAVSVLSQLPASHVWLPAVPSWWVAVFYAALSGWVITSRTKRSRRYLLAGSLLWLSIGYGLAIMPSLRERTAVQATFIDVAHGTSVLLEFPGGANCLYDCGRMGNFRLSSRGIQEVLWDRGLTHLDAVILSHADTDHYNALPGLLHRFKIQQVIVPPGLFLNADPVLSQIRQQLDRRGIPIHEVAMNEPLYLPDWQPQSVELRVMHPPRPPLNDVSDNANSLVLEISHQGKRLLLPGDLEPPGTEYLVAWQRPAAGGVMMAAHHGSLTADSETLLDWARPRQVIVSGGPRAKHPKVTELLSYRGSDVYVTAKDGAIRVRLDQAVEVRCFLREPW